MLKLSRRYSLCWGARVAPQGLRNYRPSNVNALREKQPRHVGALKNRNREETLDGYFSKGLRFSTKDKDSRLGPRYSVSRANSRRSRQAPIRNRPHNKKERGGEDS